MPWNGSGTFSRIVTSVSPATTGTTIDSVDQNTYTADVTTGINAALAKNGENAATGDLDIGGNKITNLDDGVADDDAATVAQVNAIGEGTFVNNANGAPNISDTSIDLYTTLTVDTWESIGPTGSGSDHIWTALDSVPAGIDWVEVKIRSDGEDTSGTLIALNTWARATGSSQAANIPQTRVAGIYMTGASGSLRVNSLNIAKIPVDSERRFDMHWSTVTSVPTSGEIDVILTGYGTN